MEADQSCLERGCGSFRRPVRSSQEPMSTRRWGQGARGIDPGLARCSVSESRRPHTLRAEQRAERSAGPPPPFFGVQKTVLTPPA